MMNKEDLIGELMQMTIENMHEAQSLQKLSDETLNFKPDNESWSILECIEHLNRYGNFYIPEITKRIDAAKPSSSNKFKSGLLGNYFAKSMLPKEKLNKMKTFKSMNPQNSDLDKNVIDTFIKQQEQLISLLDQARKIDLTKTKTAISISSFIKLRIGDTFRVVIYHNLRHIVQVRKILNHAEST